MPIYREAIENRAVKKTLTIPQWLNGVAVKQNINFSKVLVEGLKSVLKLEKDKDNEDKVV